MPTDHRLEADAAEKLIAAIQELSLARDLRAVMDIVRRAARQLTGADGATFVLKDGTYCYYAEEDAISPLWKGSRFPMSSCISGWVMMNREPAVIPDIFSDPRIPVEAYRPTFVKSLAMVPIRTEAPIAAIGNYWAHEHTATPQELKLLQALANSTSVAMENIEILADLERRVERRTVELATANRELENRNQDLEAFAYSASHDLRAPLRTIVGFVQMLSEEEGHTLTAKGESYLDRIHKAGVRMDALVNDLLALARVSVASLHKEPINLTELVDDVLRELAANESTRKLKLSVARDATTCGDRGLLRIVLENLLSNAWKFTAQRPEAKIEFGFTDQGSHREFYVRDNGAGFPTEQTAKLFVPFQRLHVESDFPGVGIGLATVRRIITKHGGIVSAEGAEGKGATFYFTLPIVPASRETTAPACAP